MGTGKEKNGRGRGNEREGRGGVTEKGAPPTKIMGTPLIGGKKYVKYILFYTNGNYLSV